MNREKIVLFSAVVVAVGCAVLALGWWLTRPPAIDVRPSVPGMDGRDAAKAGVKSAKVIIGEFFETFPQAPPTVGSESWPRFRGACFDNICRQNVPLADHWPTGGPNVLWSIKLGEGHAAAAVRDGRVYVLDYDEKLMADRLRCLSLENGKDLWNRWYLSRVKRNHGRSRTIPAVSDDYVVTLGPKCHVMCVAAKTGEFKWGLDLVSEFGSEVPLWYAGQCPLIDDGIAVLAPVGGKVLMMGVDCETGEMLWSVPNDDGWKMSHSSILPLTLAGKRTYVYAAVGGIVGVSAENADRGTLLWKTGDWNQKVIAPSPLALGDDRVLITAGYGAGGVTFKVVEKDGVFEVVDLKAVGVKEGLASEQQTPILFENRVFAILPKDAGAMREQFVCADPNDITKILWSSGKTHRFGLGPYVIADGKFYILDDDGVLTMAKATIDGFEPLDQAKALDGHDAWGPIAVVGRKMILRDSKTMICLDVGVEK